ncbi:MAG: FAD-dependent oxidoreductase [Clostridiales bacterium]|nr:FAD-dependent oxidoreductase [Clostridiales bacterium]
MIYQKQLEVKYETDILVVGGGAAGVTAAIAAARMGKRVLIIESGGCFGGVGTTGMVPAFCTFGDGVNRLSDGIGWEIRSKVCPENINARGGGAFQAETLKRAYDDAIAEAGVEFLFFTTLADAVARDGHIEYVVLTSKSGMYAVKAKVYLDCTGDGDFTAIAGGAFELGNEEGKTMPPSVCSLWTDFDNGAYRTVNIPEKLEQAFADGDVFTYEDRHLTGLCHRLADELGGGNIGHIFGTDPIDMRSISDAMVWGRKSLLEYQNFYRRYVAGCENIKLVENANMLGVRESRRIVCDYMLSVDDFRAKANFDDEIGRYCYPVDIHVMDTSPEEMERFKREFRSNLRYGDGESYGIPYRSLVPVSFDNLLTAGRCLGADRQMEASIRVMPGCFITGQAAGTAAALSLDKDGEVRSVDPSRLQRELKKAGAYLRPGLGE